MFARRMIIALLAIALGAGGALLAAVQEEWTQPTKKWAKGPVKWIFTKEEKKAIKKATTDEELMIARDTRALIG